MQRPPRPPQAPILDATLIWRVVLVGILMLAGSFGLFLHELQQGHSLAEARTTAVNVFVMVEAMYLFNCRSLTRPLTSLAPFSNPWVWVGVGIMAALQLLFTYTPLFHRLFGTASIGLDAWAQIGAVGLAALVLIEIEKGLRRRRALR